VVQACDAEAIIVGQVPTGGQCAASFECQTGNFCYTIGNEGACVALLNEGDLCFIGSPGTAAAGCRNDVARDGVHLYCDTITGTCQQRRQLGDSCGTGVAGLDSNTVPCVAPYYCDPLGHLCVDECQRGHNCATDLNCDKTQGLTCEYYTSSVSICDVGRQANQPCGANDDCIPSLRCASNSDPAYPYIKTCQARLADNTIGCTLDSDCASGFCDITIAIARTCRPQVAPPGACPSGNDHQCLNGYCSASTCFSLVADGNPCALDHECQSGSCAALSCAHAPLDDGHTCSAGTQCKSNFCNFDTPRTCDHTPLANGRQCTPGFTGPDTDCASDACINGVCGDGLGQGATCSTVTGNPCALNMFCDTTLTPNSCQPKHGPGDDCTSSAQCYGTCITFTAGSGSRKVCDAQAPLGSMTCDGSEVSP
jgi:hypothetical protein